MVCKIYTISSRFFMFVLLILLTISNQNGQAQSGDSLRYVPGELIIRLSASARLSSALLMDTTRRSDAFSGFAELDNLLSNYGLVEFRKYRFEPKNTELAHELGLDRDLRVILSPLADIPAILKRLDSMPYVTVAVPNVLGRFSSAPNDPHYPLNWGYDNQGQFSSWETATGNHTGPQVGTVDFDSDLDEAWDRPSGTGKASVVIAILDGGVDLNHPDLRLVAGFDFIDNDSEPDDVLGHGTNVAGIVAAVGNNCIGATGVAGGCSIMPLRVGHPNGAIVFSAVTNALIYAADNGADVANMSFLMQFNIDPQLSIYEAAIDYAYLSGVTLFASSNNTPGATDSIILQPAAFENVIAIGAASPCGERKRLGSEPAGVTCDGEEWGSIYGTGLDFLAPTSLPTTDILGSGGETSGDYNLYFNGTSCSAPYAAGIAALILSEDPTLTPAQVKQRMIDGSVDITGGEASVGYDIFTGWGMLNANNSLLLPVSDTLEVPVEYSSIQAAIAAASDYDIVLVDTGIYNEALDYLGKKVRVVSKQGPVNTVITSPAGVNLVTFDDNEDEDSWLQGFRLEGGKIGILCRNASPRIENNLLVGQNTVIYGAITLEGPTSGSTGGSPALIRNNTIVNCAGIGLDDRSSSPPTIKNNIIANNFGIGINYNAFPLKAIWHPDLSYNDVWNNGANYNNITDIGTGAISADPNFFGALGLRNPSPCIDTGDPFMEYHDPDCSRNDMGALPFPEGGPSLPPGGFKTATLTPRKFIVRQNYPNPFNPTTRISFDVPIASNWSVAIYNLAGQSVERFSGESESGVVTVEWDASNHASGVYFYTVRAGSRISSRKMMLLK